MSLKHLQPFQVDPDRVNQQEIANLVNKVSINSKVSEIQGIFDRNISLCAYLLRHAYIDYQDIYFLSTSLIPIEDNRPDYICGCYHAKKGVSWYAIICAGPQEQTWDDDLQLTTVAKLSFDRLNYCTSNLERILLSNKIVDEVDPDRIHGLLIIGQDREFFQNPKKQDRKRDINQNSPVKLRTYGAFLRKFGKKNKSWLTIKLGNFLDRMKKSDGQS
jgi:hypothetical protein